MDTGTVCYVLAFPRALYYDVISEQAGVALHSDGELISFLADMGRIQADYQHIRSALNDVRTKGYGVVAPAPGDLQLAEPEIVRKGGRYGVRLKASAKAIHMFQTNIETEISPEIGGENASSEILGFLLQGFDGDVEQLWQSNIFGKPIYTIAQEGVEEKLSCLPTKAVGKLQETLQRVVNEGSGTLICLASGNRLADAFLRIAYRYNRHPAKRRMPVYVVPVLDFRICVLKSGIMMILEFVLM